MGLVVLVGVPWSCIPVLPWFGSAYRAAEPPSSYG